MLKKVLITVSLLAITSTTLTSCSIWNRIQSNWSTTDNKSEVVKDSHGTLPASGSTELASENDSLFDENTLVEEIDTVSPSHQYAKGYKPHKHDSVVDGAEYPNLKIPSNRKHDIVAVSPEKHDLKGVSCIEVTYNTLSDKVQTLGYIKAGSEASYTSKHHEHRKSVAIAKTGGKKIAKKPAKIYAAKPKTISELPVQNEANSSNDVAPNSILPTTDSPQDHHSSMPDNSVKQLDSSSPLSQPSVPSKQAEPMAPQATPLSELPTQSLPNKPVEAPIAPKQPSQTASHPSQLPPVPQEPSLPEVAPVEIKNKTGNTVTLDFKESEIDISSTNMAQISQIIEDLKVNPNKNIKIQSYAFSKEASINDARRNALQRAIKIRKYLIDNGINASHISVNAIEDINNKLNVVEISLEAPKS